MLTLELRRALASSRSGRLQGPHRTRVSAERAQRTLMVVGITELGRCSAPAGEIALLATMAGSEVVEATEEGDSCKLKYNSIP